MLNRFDRRDHSKENRKTVISSCVIAKAVVSRNSGEYQVMVVFQKSTRLEFYWVFSAKSPRSSRRSWKLAGTYARDFNIGNHKPYTDFGSFVSHHALMYNAQILSIRTPHKRRLASLLSKTEQESIYGDWTPQNPLRMTTEMCRKRAMHARDRRFVW